jgi:hypothetical protein
MYPLADTVKFSLCDNITYNITKADMQGIKMKHSSWISL